MAIARRLFSLGIALTLAALAASPAEALRCRTVSACPMMANAEVPCHGGETGAGMTVPMDCCRQDSLAPPAPTVLAAAAAVLFALPAPSADFAPGLVPGGGFRANLQALGLFTLHAVWRI
jgi:hypothetical protein